MNYMDRITTHVEKKITKILPSKFELLVDGWSALDTNYLAVFETFTANTETKYDQVLLGFAPFESEENMKAENQVDFIKFVLDLFDKSLHNVVSVTADNTNVNVKFVRSIGCGFVYCAIHRFQLAIKDIISTHSQLIEKVRNLLKKLRNPSAAGQLRKHTHLNANFGNVTRRSSVADMLNRYMQVSTHLEELDLE